MSKRTPQQEMSAWKTRVAELLSKEARCPGCAKAKRVNEGTTNPVICLRHQEIRQSMALMHKRRRYNNV
jgi:hypothetical protein